jgi:hypothetical protein
MEHGKCGWNGCSDVPEHNSRTGKPFFYCALHTKLRKKHKDTYYMKSKIQYNQDNLRRYHNLRLEVLKLYGNKCNCCGETELCFLALDHVHGNGQKHRESRGGNYGVFKDAIAEYGNGKFQVLCHNCNMAKALYGNCPHQLASLKEMTHE